MIFIDKFKILFLAPIMNSKINFIKLIVFFKIFVMEDFGRQFSYSGNFLYYNYQGIKNAIFRDLILIPITESSNAFRANIIYYILNLDLMFLGLLY